MSLMPSAFKAILVQAFTDNVTHIGFHTASPGTTGVNDSVIAHLGLSWGSINDGVCSAIAEFAGLTGDFTHIGLWEGATFRQGIPCEIHYSAPADIAVQVTHIVGDDA